jgi:hypothetical protein
LQRDIRLTNISDAERIDLAPLEGIAETRHSWP